MATDPTPDPTPTDLVRELRDAVGLFSGAIPITPRQAWDEAIAVAKRAVRERDAYAAALVALDPTTAQRPVRSAGGGDQPDTPCPHCNGDGESDESPLVPCPACLGTGRACTPSPEDSTDG